MRKIGIMGGTFNPIHYGHLLIAENAREQLSLDEVRFMPAGKTPHKSDRDVLDGAHRLNMVELAIRGNPCFVADDRELRSGGVSYTCRTLSAMREEDPDSELYFIVGGDSLRDLKTWYHPEVICACAKLAAAVRDENDEAHLLGYAEELRVLYGADVRLIHSPNLSVTSSGLRLRVAAGQTIRYQAPEEVCRYIKQHGLYRQNAANGDSGMA